MTIRRFLYQLTFSWVNLVVALIYLLTLGFYWPNWLISYAAWFAKKDIERAKKLKEDTRDYS